MDCFVASLLAMTGEGTVPPRHCEHSEAIHRATSGDVDCFVASLLAMTVVTVLWVRNDGEPPTPVIPGRAAILEIRYYV
jgi:hypothetical protein